MTEGLTEKMAPYSNLKSCRQALVASHADEDDRVAALEKLVCDLVAVLKVEQESELAALHGRYMAYRAARMRYDDMRKAALLKAARIVPASSETYRI